MLYATTRSDRDVYTAQRALTRDQGPEGGLYVPYRAQKLSGETLRRLEEKKDLDILASAVNALFGTRLTAWDVEFTVGRKPLRLKSLNRKTLAGERWHNPKGTMETMISEVTDRIRVESLEPGKPGLWAQVSMHAVSLGILLTQVRRQGIGQGTIDIALPGEDLTGILGALFAGSWGLPVGRILCGCRAENPLWELLHSGSLRTDRHLPQEVELLLYCCGGRREVQRYLDACFANLNYVPMENTFRRLQQRLYACVVSETRAAGTLSSVCAAHGYLMHPATAYAYVAILDYRAETGESGYGMLLADRSPSLRLDDLGKALGLSQEAVRHCLNKMYQ